VAAEQYLKLVLAYDGTEYQGWQVQKGQPESRTIQGELEKALETLCGRRVTVTGAGRTDAGVHAVEQVASLKTISSIPAERFPPALNSLLPPDIVIRSAQEIAPEFHARFSARQKTYRYYLDPGPVPDVFWRRYALNVKTPLNWAAMNEAAASFTGKHDFRAFCASGSSVTNFTRTVTCCRWVTGKDKPYLEITADGFLYHMVRIMVGTMLEVGRGKFLPADVTEMLKGSRQPGPTAPAKGLFLYQVSY